MKKIPIGIENFKELIDSDYYFVDKSLFIKDVIDEKIVLYTRPRRFGKTLNMSMLNYFFNIKEKDNAYLFNNLEISKNKEIMKHQNQYPVIFITLKDMQREDYHQQIIKYSAIIAAIVIENKELISSEKLDEDEKKLMKMYKSRKSSISDLQDAIMNISKCLEKCYNKKVIILVDEYDVPLQDAYKHGYYDEMVNFLKNTFSAALKTNDSLEKGIMTGCLRIAKESIFTGLNNFNVYSILDKKSSLRFGFIQEEVSQILKDYHLSQYIDEVKKWYDGYLFGNSEIYNPWSVLKFVHKSLYDNAVPESFWANTSGNDLVYNYIKKGNLEMKNDFEKLIQNQSIIKTIMPELTYRDMDRINNIYSFLLFTGYLKIKEQTGAKEYELVIPNKEIQEIYEQTFNQYFEEFVEDRKDIFVDALIEENTEKADNVLNQILKKSISYYDNYENFYHGFLVGLLQGYDVESNREAGNGRFDIVIKPQSLREKCIIIECKKSSSLKQMIADSKNAAHQIIEKKYIEGMLNEGYLYCIGYGISFYKKQCYITKA